MNPKPLTLAVLYALAEMRMGESARGLLPAFRAYDGLRLFGG